MLKKVEQYFKDLDLSYEVRVRGLQYYLHNRIEFVEVESHEESQEWFFLSHGQADYKTRLSFSPQGKIISGECTCPFPWGSCKHISGALLMLFRNQHMLQQLEEYSSLQSSDSENLSFRQVIKQLSKSNMLSGKLEYLFSPVTDEKNEWGFEFRIRQKEKGDILFQTFQNSPKLSAFHPEFWWDQQILSLVKTLRNDIQWKPLKQEWIRFLLPAFAKASCFWIEGTKETPIRFIAETLALQLEIKAEKAQMMFQFPDSQNREIKQIYHNKKESLILTRSNEVFMTSLPLPEKWLKLIWTKQNFNMSPDDLWFFIKQDRIKLHPELKIKNIPSHLDVHLPSQESSAEAELKLDLDLKNQEIWIQVWHCERPYLPVKTLLHPQGAIVTVRKNKKNLLLKRSASVDQKLLNLLDQSKAEVHQMQYRIKTQDRFQFVSERLKEIQKNYSTILSPAFRKWLKSFQKPNIKIQVNPSGQRWFEVKMIYQIGQQQFTHEQLMLALRNGKNLLKLKSGDLFLLQRDLIEQMEAKLKRAGVENGKLAKAGILGLNQEFKKESAGLENLETWEWETDPSIKKWILQLQKPLPKKPFKTPLFNGQLRPYQSEGVHWLARLHELDLSGILADDMGLGKTIQVLAWLAKIQTTQKKPSLIVCPTSVMENWESEIHKFSPTLKSLLISGTGRQKQWESMGSYDLILCSYALLQRDIEKIKLKKFFYIILDEAQWIKNSQSKTAQAVYQIVGEHHLALSGTPIENRVEELWSLFRFLLPGYLGSLDFFTHQFVQRLDEPSIQELLKIRTRSFILRRTKQEVAKDLPEKTIILHRIEMNPEQKLLYAQLNTESREMIQAQIKKEGFARSQISIFAVLMRLRQLANHPHLIKLPSFQKQNVGSSKLDEVLRLIEEIASENNKVIVFSQFLQFLHLIGNALKAQKIDYLYLDGQTQNRLELVNDFQKTEEKKVFLCSLKAGGVGLNMTAANYVILCDPWWNPAIENQAQDRAHRIGQERKVTVYKLISKDSIEEKMLLLQEQKQELFQNFIKSGKNAPKLTEKDLQTLLDMPD